MVHSKLFIVHCSLFCIQVMKPTLPLILALVATITLSAQKPLVKELAPGVFYYFGDELQKKSANCLWVIFKDYVIAMDANYPWGAGEIIGEIRKTTSKPIRYVFNTHYHHDHTFGNAVFVDSGATVISTTATAIEMQTLGQREWDEGWGGRSMRDHRREFPTLTFDQKLVFDDGQHRVELIKMGPAHTLGDAVAYLPKEKILVTGDLCVNGNPWGNNVADQNADYNKWLTVLDTLASWNIQTVVPGHGELGTPTTLRNQRAYLADMFTQVRRGIAAGKTKDQLLKQINLSRHPVYGENTISSERSIRAMYDNLARQTAR